jgi:outer membrane protein, multidrug efflux system
MRLSIVTLAATALAGCVVGPDYQKPFLTVPAKWSDQTSSRPAKPPELSKWWQRLRDPELNNAHRGGGCRQS